MTAEVLDLLLGAGRRPSQGFASVFSYFSGPEGARVKVSPLFFRIICGVLNFLSGYKAKTRILSLGTKVKILLHHSR